MAAPIIIGVAVVIVLILIAVSVSSLRKQNESQIEDRLEKYTTDYSSLLAELEQADTEAKSRKKEQESAIAKALDKAIEKRGFSQKWKEQLARADLRITPGEFLGAHFIAIVIGYLVGFFLITPGNPIAPIAFAVAGFFAPRIYVGIRKGRRIKAFENQLPDTIGLWVNGLRSGYSVQQAMEAIGREGPEPTSGEFRRVVQELQLGVAREVALDHLLNRMPSEDLDLIITAVNIQAEVGGNLAEILDIIGGVIRERIKLKGEVSVLTSQGRMTGFVIGGLPVALLLFLSVTNPGYVNPLFTNRTCGWPMLFCMTILVGAGFAVIRKIVDIEI